MNIFSVFRGVDLLTHLSVQKCFVSAVCVVCNSNSFHFFIFKLHNDCSHIEDMLLSLCAHLINIFFIFGEC